VADRLNVRLGSMQTGPVVSLQQGSVATPLTGGADQTTATTTPRGADDGNRKTKANRTRTGRPAAFHLRVTRPVGLRAWGRSHTQRPSSRRRMNRP